MRSLRQRWLQALFALALAWVVFWVGVALSGQMEVPNPAPEGHWLHGAIEDFAPPLLAVALAGVATALVIRRWPCFSCSIPG